MVCTQFLNMSGYLTRSLSKHLQKPNSELGEIITNVSNDVIAFKGVDQKPVREFN